MANNTTWSFTGLPSGSTIMSYSPQIPGVNFALVNSDGVHTLLNAGGTPTQVGNFTPTIRVGTSSCYKDVRVTMNVTQATPTTPTCAVALANGTHKLGLSVGLSPGGASVYLIDGMSLDITPSSYGTFSYSYVSGDNIPGISLVAVPRAGTWWQTDPASHSVPAALDAATISSFAGKVFNAIWRVTLTTTTGCQASLDFPVEFRVYDATRYSTPIGPGGFEGGS